MKDCVIIDYSRYLG